MSGLELAAGVIAVVQVTGQAAVLIHKIKTLWGEVRDAPEDILYLLEEVELTSLTLQSIEQQVQQSKMAGMACDPVLEAVLKHAQGAYQALQKVADLLDREIQQSRGKTQRFVKSAKVLLKRPVLDRLKSRLESSLRLLVLASHVQMNVMVSRSTSIIFERLPKAPPRPSLAITGAEDDASPVEASKDAEKQSQVTYYETAHRHRLDRFHTGKATQWSWTGRFNFNFSSADGGWVSIQPPSWLARSTHVLIASKALGGPHLTLRRYDTIQAWDNEVYRILEKDDWPGLETHFRTTGISPFSSDRWGDSILFEACKHNAVEIMKILLENGLDLKLGRCGNDLDPDRLLWSWQQASLCGPSLNSKGWDMSFKAQKMLLHHGLSGICDNFDYLLFALNRMPVTMIPEYVDYFMPTNRDFSPLQRLEMACQLLLRRDYNDISILLPELLDQSATENVPSRISGFILMHYLALHLGRLRYSSRLIGRNRLVPNLFQWITKCVQMDPESIMRRFDPSEDVLRHSPSVDPQALCGPGLTPILTFIVSWQENPTPRWSLAMETVSLRERFRLFLLALQDAGVDLEALGRRQRRSTGGLPIIGPGEDLLKYKWFVRRSPVDERLRVFGVSYGRHVDDWVIWHAFEYEHFAKEFWDMVENPPHLLPGSWIDEVDEEESEMESLREYVELNDSRSFIWSEVEGKNGTAVVEAG